VVASPIGWTPSFAAPSCQELLDLVEERLGARLVDAGLAAAVQRRAVRGDDRLDDLLDLALGGIERDDPVAVEERVDEHLLGIRRIGERDRIRLLAEVREQLLGAVTHGAGLELVELH